MKIHPITSEEADRYRVSHRADIESTLTGIIRSRSAVALVAGDRLTPLTLSMLVRAEKGKLWFDASRDPLINQLLTKGKAVQAVSELDQIQIRFPCRGLRLEADALSGPALVANFPSEMLRVQRRNTYRLATSVMNPVKCLIHVGETFIEASVVDLSVGGVGVLAYQTQGQLVAGETYHGCRISLPDAGEFALSLTVCSTYDVAKRNGRSAHRAGCQFLDLPASIETQIQRYILRVDRERQARFT